MSVIDEVFNELRIWACVTNSMKKYFLIIAISTLTILLLLGVLFWQGVYARHFDRPLPDSARLLHSDRHHAGIDTSFAFVFEVSDDALLKQIVDEWALQTSVKDDHETFSFVALRPPKWWLNEDELERLPIQYEWVDWNAEKYCSVWYDTANERLYVEYGQW